VENNNLWISFFLLTGSIVILTLSFLLTKWKTSRIAGWLLIILYALYLLYQIACISGTQIC
jgi:Ca2+/Na+ antiporter